jgi:hypothetical protein
MIFVTKYVQFVRTKHLVSVNIGMCLGAQKLLKHTVCKKEGKTMARKYLNVHKFNFENKEYTQKELIDKMLHGCELALSEAFKNKKLTEDEEKSVCDIPWIWATVMPAMWW